MNKIFLRKTWRDFRASWAQSLALIFVVGLGITSFFALISSYRDLSTSYDHTYERLQFADVTFRLQRGAPAAVVDEVREVAGVTAVTGRLIQDTGFELPDGEPIRARLIGIPAGEQPAVNQLVIEEGQYLVDEADTAVLLESHFADIYDLGPGDTVTPIINGETRPLTVQGVATSPEYLIVSPSQQDIFPSARTFAVLFLPLEATQSLLDAPDTVNDLAVRMAEDADQEQVTAQIRNILKSYQIESVTPRAEQPSHALLQQDVAGYRELANLMPALILLVAAISVYVMLGRMVRAQQPQIGLMKALGYRDGAVLRHYLTFALGIGLAGLLLGMAAGIPLARWVTETYATELSIPFVATQFYPELVWQSVLLCLALCLLAGYGPARRSAHLAPAAAMRVDPAAALVDGQRSWLERLIRLPLELRLPLRNVFRMRRRSFTTGLGIVFAFILVLMVWGMFDSMQIFMTRTFEEVERWDVTASFEQPQTDATLAKAREWDGVKAAEPFIQLPATLRANDEGEDVLLTGLSPAQKMHRLSLPEGETAAANLGEGDIVLTDAIAQSLNLSPGDAVEVDTPVGTKEFTYSTTTDELLSAVAYISLEDARALLPMPMPVFNGLYLTVDDAVADRVKEDLYHLPGVASVQLKADMERDIRELLGLFYVFMGVMLFFALGMAFALLFNTTTINVLERKRELATMRSLGTADWQIAAQIIAENAILWLVALLPGLLIGTWVAQQMGQAFSSELFTFDIIIQPASYLITSLGILLTMFLAAWPAIRRVNKLNLAEATKVLT